MTDNQSNTAAATDEQLILKDSWAIRPCAIYKDEYDDCTSIKARFHQYFIHGESTDCTHWNKDYENCLRYEKSNGNDVAAGAAIIRSEEERRNARLKAHFGNTTWKKRQSPPDDWAKPLPDWFAKRNENSFLQAKQIELSSAGNHKVDQAKYCTIM